MTPCPAGRAALSVIGTTAALGAATLAYSLIEARCPVLRRIDVPVLAADEELAAAHAAAAASTSSLGARRIKSGSSASEAIHIASISIARSLACTSCLEDV